MYFKEDILKEKSENLKKYRKLLKKESLTEEETKEIVSFKKRFKLCSNSYSCFKTANYGENFPTSCYTHSEKESKFFGPIVCMEKECHKRALYGLDYVVFCKEHKKNLMVNLNKKEKKPLSSSEIRKIKAYYEDNYIPKTLPEYIECIECMTKSRDKFKEYKEIFYKMLEEKDYVKNLGQRGFFNVLTTEGIYRDRSKEQGYEKISIRHYLDYHISFEEVGNKCYLFFSEPGNFFLNRCISFEDFNTFSSRGYYIINVKISGNLEEDVKNFEKCFDKGVGSKHFNRFSENLFSIEL